MEQRKVENNKGRNSEGGNGVYELSEQNNRNICA